MHKESAIHYWELTLQNAKLLNGNTPFVSCLELLKAENYSEIESKIRDMLAQEPHSAPAHAFLGIAHYFSGRTDEALSSFEKSLAIDNDIAVSHYFSGSIIIRRNSWSSNALARAHFQTAAKIYPDWFDNQVMAGKFCHNTGANDEAVAHLQKAVDLDPTDAGARFLLVSVLTWLGEYDKLEFHLQEANKVTTFFQPELAIMKDESADDKKAIRHVRYPSTKDINDDFIETLKSKVLGELDDIPPFLEPKSKCFALGSCYAQHMTNALTAVGHHTYNLNIDEAINTTFASRRIFAWLTNDVDANEEKAISDLIPNITREYLRNEIRSASAFIYSMGSAACFFDRKSDQYILPSASFLNSRALAGKHKFRTTTVAENVSNMEFVIEAIHKINPTIKIFLAISPVALKATFERKSSVIADCLSKSVLRLTAEEISKASDNDVYYWPIFEIVRWLGGHTGPVYGVDDGSSLHVSEKLLDQVIKLFLEMFRNKVAFQDKKLAS